MGVSIITSLYRSDAHIESYMRHVERMMPALYQASIPLEIVIVANDATPEERSAIERFQHIPNLAIKALHVPRESLYTSWNRGIEAASYDVLGFWNVDDIRTSAGIQQGHQLLQDGTIQIVDFPYEIVQDGIAQRMPSQYKPDSLSPKSVTAPFFMFHRHLYQQADGFNPNFRIVGDYEWSKRAAVRNANFAAGDVVAGQFFLHGGNLSGGNSPLEWVEYNIVLLWHGLDQDIRPVDPHLMQIAWEKWGYQGAELQPKTAEWLWGDGAQARYEQYQKERTQHPLLRRMRLALARRNILQSVEWDVHNHSK